MQVIVKLLLCIIFSCVNNYSDWKEYKIRNRSVIIFLFIGIVFSFVTSGIGGIVSSVEGGLLMIVLFPLFALRMLGAGDIKALIGIGVMLGFPMAINGLLYCVMGAGLIAMITLLFRKNAADRFTHLWSYIKTCWLSRSVLPYKNNEEKDYGGNFRFSYGITAGIAVLFVIEIIKVFRSGL